jgi:hypothetical protein
MQIIEKNYLDKEWLESNFPCMVGCPVKTEA